MVSLYFDYRFVDLLASRDDWEELIVHDFCNQFLRRIRGVEVYVNLKSLDELKERVLTDKFWNYISEIGPIKLLDFKPNLDSSKFYKKGALSKIFFVEGCNEQLLQETYSLIFISNNSLKVKWPLFMSNRDDSQLRIKSNPSQDDSSVFKSWSDLSVFSHPIRNILLFDFYIACDKSNQKLDDNLIPLIQSLLTANLGKANDLLIFTKGLPDATISGSNVVWKLQDIQKVLKRLVALNPLVEKINFINYNSTKVTTDPEHNRYLLTNYFMIKTEAGFNIFQAKNGLVNKRDSITFQSLLINRFRNDATDIVNNLKLYCANINNEGKDYKGETEYYYLSPLQSRFLRDI